MKAIRIHCSHDFVELSDVGILEITADDATDLIKKMATVERLRSMGTVKELVLWDARIKLFSENPDDIGDIADIVFDLGIADLADVDIPEHLLKATEGSCVHVTPTDVRWSGYLKGSDIEWDTATLDKKHIYCLLHGPEYISTIESAITSSQMDDKAKEIARARMIHSMTYKRIRAEHGVTYGRAREIEFKIRKLAGID